MKTEIPDLTGYQAKHFLWRVENRVGYLTLNRPEKKNPLTFESYAELRDLFRLLHDGGACASSWWTARAAISARAAMCTRSSARSRKWTRKGCSTSRA
jgi:hypothetical protein